MRGTTVVGSYPYPQILDLCENDLVASTLAYYVTELIMIKKSPTRPQGQNFLACLPKNFLEIRVGIHNISFSS